MSRRKRGPMKRGTAVLMTALTVVYFNCSLNLTASEKAPNNKAEIRNSTREAQGGFRTDRLSAKQLRVWRKIEHVVFARDNAGNLLHPTLESLWRQVESSGYEIFIEMTAQATENMAGKFIVENPGQDGKHSILSIHIYVATIDKANTSNWARRADGFIPFEKLENEKRYAEVLGHELGHAVRTLQDPGYVALSREQDRLEAEFFSRSRASRKTGLESGSDSMMKRLDALAKEVEAPANAAEIKVWRELAQKSANHPGGRLMGSQAFLNRPVKAELQGTHLLKALRAARKIPPDSGIHESEGRSAAWSAGHKTALWGITPATPKIVRSPRK